MGYRGYFSVGLFNGLLDKAPTHYNVKPEIGTPVITIVTPPDIDSTLKQKIGEIFGIEVAFYRSNFVSVPKDPEHPVYRTPIDTIILDDTRLSEDPGILIWLIDIILPLLSSEPESKENELGKLIVDLWKCGWFLSDWATSLYLNSGKISQANFHLHPDLYRGGDSMIDGTRAFNILKMIRSTICKS